MNEKMEKKMSEESGGSDGISVFELFDIVVAYKWLISGLTALGGISAFAFVSIVLHPVWEASSIIEVGRIPGQSELIEPAPNVVSRMMHPSFYAKSLALAPLKPEEVDRASRELRSLVATQVKNTELVDVKIRARSPEKAQMLLEASVANLKKVHEEKVAQLFAIIKQEGDKEIALIDKQLQQALGEEAVLKKKLFTGNAWNTFDVTLASTLLYNKTLEINKLSTAKVSLELKQNPARVIPTKMVGEIYVSDGPVSPRVPLFVGAGLLAGLLGALFIVYVHNLFRKRPRDAGSN